MYTYQFKTNINCGSCIKSVTPFLNELDEVDAWKVDTASPDKILEITLEEATPKVVMEAVTEAGFRIEELSKV